MLRLQIKHPYVLYSTAAALTLLYCYEHVVVHRIVFRAHIYLKSRVSSVIKYYFYKRKNVPLLPFSTCSSMHLKYRNPPAKFDGPNDYESRTER